MPPAETFYRVYRRRWPMLPALIFGLLQIAAGLDTLLTNYILPRGHSVLTTTAAALFLVLGFVLTAFVVISLARPVPLIQANEDGLVLAITEPGQPPVLVPWDALKSVEIGRVGPDESRRGDPECLILRFNGSRVKRPEKLYGVFHSTKGSLYFRGSQLPALEPIVARLTALQREFQKR